MKLAYALSYSQVTRWVNEIKNGRECVQDAHGAGRTVTATDSYNTEQLKSDRRITCKEMTQELEISVGSVHNILCNHLKMRKVSARWKPHRLTSDQAERRLEVAIHLLSRFHSEGKDVLYQELLQLTKRGWGRMNRNWRDNQPSGTHQAPRG